MKTFRVTIRATVTKTLTVEGADEDEAREAAHGEFSVLCDGDEDYDEETLDIEEIEEAK